MINQAFSAENFRSTFDYENRKGVYLEGKFFPEMAKVTDALKTNIASIRRLRGSRGYLSADAFRDEHSKLAEKIQALQRTKEEMLEKTLSEISEQIAAPDFRIGVAEASILRLKKIYSIDNTPAAYFALKQLQYNIRTVYRVKQPSRYEIVCQLTDLLGDSFPKYIIRTDIESFYESVPTGRLLKMIDGDASLTLPSRKMIRQILISFQKVSGLATGVPRGIGISAYLAELYLRDFDKLIRGHDEIIFYARYVDDMIMIFAPRPNSSTAGLKPFVENLAVTHGLKLNLAKTKDYDLTKPQKCELEYLGYRIWFGEGAIRVGISDKRKRRYEARVGHSFDEYKKKAKFDEKKARKLLVNRIKFLTGNTRLKNNKGNILVGAYFSNSLLSDSSELRPLDSVLEAQVNSLSSASLKARLAKLSFETGFSLRRYHSFTTGELSQIARLWKHEA